MPRIGVRKTATEFILTLPNSEKSVVCEVEENTLDSLLADEFSDVSQELLGALYGQAKDSQTPWSRLVTVFRTENVFWHIQMVLTVTLFAVAGYFAALDLAGVEIQRTPEIPAHILIFLAIGVAGYSTYALFTQKRPRKRAASMGLFLTFLYQNIYMHITGQGGTILTITLLSLTGVAVALYTEWSRPSK